ncbi:MAG: hypothetical protein J1E40_05580 [Oscillospiraceae bacterium]|nr:hypothetical protein [Oscillospiraceae bacterium]
MKGKTERPVGIGTGYLSIMMIFVVLCLTLLAALSYSTASTENGYSQKSGEYTKAYYAADLAAKQTLAAVDSAAAKYDDYTDFMLLAELDEIEGVEYTVLMNGLEVRWVTPVNKSQSISSAVRYSGAGYEMLEWRTVSVNDISDNHLNVWSGE